MNRYPNEYFYLMNREQPKTIYTTLAQRAPLKQPTGIALGVRINSPHPKTMPVETRTYDTQKCLPIPITAVRTTLAQRAPLKQPTGIALGVRINSPHPKTMPVETRTYDTQKCLPIPTRQDVRH